MKLKRFGWADVLLFIILIIGVLYSVPSLKSLQPAYVTVTRDSQIIAEYPVTEDKTFSVDGHEGEVVIAIKNGAVSIQKSNCKHQICIRAGAIKQAYGQIICAPNHLLILISSKNTSTTDIDAVAR